MGNNLVLTLTSLSELHENEYVATLDLDKRLENFTLASTAPGCALRAGFALNFSKVSSNSFHKNNSYFDQVG
jgi:hypothetical protein